jgi:hypothetical protein
MGLVSRGSGMVIGLAVIAIAISVATSAEQANPYTVLRVPRDATVKEIKQQFRILAMEYHPDRYDCTVVCRSPSLTHPHHSLPSTHTPTPRDLVSWYVTQPCVTLIVERVRHSHVGLVCPVLL